jgi:excisionase family DNA binding protein
MKYDKDSSLYVPIWEKSNLTVEEAASYSGIGRDKIKEISNGDNCPFVLWIGTKRLIKRKQFDAYIDKMFSL